MKALKQAPVCHGCKAVLSGLYTQALGFAWHAACWSCGGCGKHLEGPFVERSGLGYHAECYDAKFGLRCRVCQAVIRGAYHLHEGQPICERDYQTNFVPRCYYCDEPLIGTFKINAHGQKACRRHEQGVRCASCERWLDPQEWRLPALTTYGTVLCRHCQHGAVGEHELLAYDNTFGARALQELGLELGAGAQIPIRLDTAAAVEALEGPLDKGVHGLTLTHVTSLQGVETGRTIQGIVVVGGLARAHFEAILAHEFGHVWLFRKRLEQRPPILVEGFCELVRYRWLARDASSLALGLQSRMMENSTPIYGDGFRQMKAIWDQTGIRGVLNTLGL